MTEKSLTLTIYLDDKKITFIHFSGDPNVIIKAPNAHTIEDDQALVIIPIVALLAFVSNLMEEEDK